MKILKYHTRNKKSQDLPLVSVIVPNYNHEKYLEQRLESIYNQTYKNFEVWLMDDCSTDKSKNILEAYCLRYQNNTYTLFNQTKAQSVAEQWCKGMLEAKGDLIWIAESDDWCTTNFLETLVPYFKNHATMLAYCNTINMNGEGNQKIGSIQKYLHDLSKDQWNDSFMQTAAMCVRETFSIKNIVPNASGVLFRKPERSFFDNKKWMQFCYAGDWLFYLNLIRGGLIAYSMEATNYFRIHSSNNTQLGFLKDQFYTEHEEICLFIKEHYNIPHQNFERMHDIIKNLWLHHYGAQEFHRMKVFQSNMLNSCLKVLNNRYSRFLYRKLFKHCQVIAELNFNKLFSMTRVHNASRKRRANLLFIDNSDTSLLGYQYSSVFITEVVSALRKEKYSITFLKLNPSQKDKNHHLPVIYGVGQLHQIVSDFMIEIVYFCGVTSQKSILNMLEVLNETKVNVKTLVVVPTENNASNKLEKNEKPWEDFFSILTSKADKIIYTNNKKSKILNTIQQMTDNIASLNKKF